MTARDSSTVVVCQKACIVLEIIALEEEDEGRRWDAKTPFSLQAAAALGARLQRSTSME